MKYGYTRVSTPHQSIDRQIRNIKNRYNEAIIIQEAYTGTTMDRPCWNRFMRKVQSGDLIIFDSVSRMARTADEGVESYFALFDKGVSLEFIQEPHIDTSVYADSLHDRISLTGTDEDEIFKGLNNYFRKLAEKQIRIAFEQAEKEVRDLRIRTREGMETARLQGKQIGAVKGRQLVTKKSIAAKEVIKKHNVDFGGGLSDAETIRQAGISRNSFYKYKKELHVEYMERNNYFNAENADS